MTDTYHIIVVPCYGPEISGDTVTANVQQVLGSVALHPTYVEELKMSPYAVFREILKAERSIGKWIYAAQGLEIDLSPTVSETPYVLQLKHKIVTCLNKTPMTVTTAAMLGDIINEHFMLRDADHVFAPEHASDMKIYHAMKANVAYQLPSLVKTALQDVPIGSDSIAIVLLDAKFQYEGHVYVDYTPDTANMIGIRTSMTNAICREMKNVALKLLSGVIGWAQAHNLSQLSVGHPAKVMVNILTKLGVFTQDDINLVAKIADVAKVVPTPTTYTEYGPYLPDLVKPLLTTPAFEQDIKTASELLQLTPDEVRPLLTRLLLQRPHDIARFEAGNDLTPLIAMYATSETDAVKKYTETYMANTK